MNTSNNPRFRAGFLLGALALSACAGSKVRPQERVRSPGHAWNALRCTSCDKAGVSIDVRRSIDDRGQTGQHAVARVRNLTSREMAFTLEVAAAELPDSELYIPSERWRVVLGPSGQAGGEVMLMLRHTAATSASVHGVEKLRVSD